MRFELCLCATSGSWSRNHPFGFWLWFTRQATKEATRQRGNLATRQRANLATGQQVLRKVSAELKNIYDKQLVCIEVSWKWFSIAAFVYLHSCGSCACVCVRLDATALLIRHVWQQRWTLSTDCLLHSLLVLLCLCQHKWNTSIRQLTTSNGLTEVMGIRQTNKHTRFCSIMGTAWTGKKNRNEKNKKTSRQAQVSYCCDGDK